MKRAAVAVAAVVGLFGAIVACGTSDVTIPPPDDAGTDARVDSGNGNGEGGSLLAANGATCAGDTACSSGHCADGVCCDSACDGTCESCKAAGAPVGTCSPVADGTDPELECQPAGTGADDFDASAPFTVPDGGPKGDANQCAGHCNGARACTFTPAGTKCGATFCGNASEEGVATCDGAGRCLYGVEECGSYRCANGTSGPGCKTACDTDADCLKPYFCKTTTKACVAKAADGMPCGDAVECTSGACTSFYPDLDGDGYGGATSTAIGFCGTTAPAGYSAINDDCFDANSAVAKLVNPGQAEFFAKPYVSAPGVTPSYDYDCSGTVDKETAEDGSCGFCTRSIIIQAQPAIPPIGFCRLADTCTSTTQAAGHACGGVAGCTANNTPEFAATVACGASAITYTCEPCAEAGGTSTAAPGDPLTQRCH